MRNEALVPTGIAARRLGVSRERVLQLCNSGALQHIRDASGRRLILEGKIEELRRERELTARRAQRQVLTP